MAIMAVPNTQLPPIPPSPTRSSASTAVPPPSVRPPPPPPLPKHFLSHSDISASIANYEHLSETAKAYRKALQAVASTASAFGSALEACARCKGAGETGEGLMNAGGLQFLIASNLHILSQSLHRGFEAVLLHEVDSYKEKIAENEERYLVTAREKTRELRKREQQHLKLTRQKKRDLAAVRNTLVDLTDHIDALEALKYGHYRTAYDLSETTAQHVLDCSSLVVRAEIEVFEKIAQKGWDSSGGLDDLIAKAADPFSPNYGQGGAESEIFSILPSESILPTSPGLGRTGSLSTSRLDGKYQSLSAALSNGPAFDDYDDEDSQSIFSEGASSPQLVKAKAPMSDSACSVDWGDTSVPVLPKPSSDAPVEQVVSPVETPSMGEMNEWVRESPGLDE